MATASIRPRDDLGTHVNVLIAGAGISGIGSAYHLQQQCPDKSYVILEMKDTFGGTWETHKYPGCVRIPTSTRSATASSRG